MKEEKLKDWAQFKDRVLELRATPRGKYLLFRGHRNANWPLEPTLERQEGGDRFMTVPSYLRLIRSIKPEIETFTGESWAIGRDAADEMERSLGEEGRQPTEAYEYMAYLRHHGFPSPLLDWTASPYIAAFFAFSGKLADRVAIFVYLEYPEGGKTWWETETRIGTLGNTIKTAKNHFRQQSQYTFCYASSIEGKVDYRPHETAIVQEGEALWKFTLPASEHGAVLDHLYDHNITRFTLFGTTEGLMSSLANRLLVFQR